MVAKRRTAVEVPDRRRLAVEIASAPFLALLWVAVALLVHVSISNRLAHQDCGLSGDPYVTLPNGYELGSGNTYDGYIKAPGFETDVPMSGPGYVRSIIDLQLSNGVFTGTQLDSKTSKLRNFVYDTRTKVFQASDGIEFASKESAGSESKELAAFGAAMTKAQTDATSYWKMYEQYRHHWPNYILAFLIVAGELALFIWTTKIWIRATAPVVA